MRKKVTVVGSGNVGASCAVRLAGKSLADVVVVDILERYPAGQVSGPSPGLLGGRCRRSAHRANDYAPTADSDIVVVTAGFRASRE